MALIRFRDLSYPLKVAVVFAFIFGITETLLFLIGFVIGFMGW